MNDPVEHEVEFDAIAAHHKIAKYYHFRSPYGASFFEKLAHKTRLGPESEVLDLCCGTGTVALGLAPHCRAVDAVDGAPDMIARSQKAENVAYHLLDIHSPEYLQWAQGRSFDLITIGMGVHWLNDTVLAGLRDQLRGRGAIATLATFYCDDQRNPWYRDFMAVRRTFANRPIQDWTGIERFESMNYKTAGQVQQVYRQQVPVSSLARNLLSFVRVSESALENFADVLATLERKLWRFVRGGMIDCYWANAAHVFVDQKSTAMPWRTQSP